MVTKSRGRSDACTTLSPRSKATPATRGSPLPRPHRYQVNNYSGRTNLILLHEGGRTTKTCHGPQHADASKDLAYYHRQHHKLPAHRGIATTDGL